MNRLFLHPWMAPVALALFTSLAQAETRYWQAETGDFLESANWNPAFGTSWDSGDTAIISNGGTAAFASGELTLVEIWVGQNGSGISEGSLLQTGGNITLTTGLVVGRQGSAIGSYTMTGGTLTANSFRVGGGPVGTTSIGTMTISGEGTQLITGGGHVGIGTTGTGTLTLQEGATWTHSGSNPILVGADNTVKGANGGTGTLYVWSGASLNLEGSGNLAVGRNPNSSGTVVVDGGSITLAAGQINLTPGYQSSSSGDRSATLTLNSGSITARLISSQYGESTINLNGGTLTVGSFEKWGTGTGPIHFNGTQIVAAASSEDFFSGYAGSGDLDVQAGGLKIDTFDNDIHFTQALSGSGGLAKSGNGTLTLSGASTYAGGTTIGGGVLVVAEGAALGSGEIVVADGGILDFDADFSLTTAGLVLESGGELVLDRNLAFAELEIGGANLEEGIYDYATLKADYAGYFADGGSGQITVGAVPEPPVLALLVAGIGAGVWLRSRRSGALS